MKCRTILGAGTFVLATLSATAQGQTKARPRTATATGAASAAEPAQPTGRPRIGYMTPTAAVPSAPIYDQPMNTTGIFTNYVVPAQTPQIAQITYYPTVVLTDGRVLANFGTGRGYEQVLRRCPQFSGPIPANVFIAPCWTVDGYGRYIVLQQR
jgi:hypothetical protein